MYTIEALWSRGVGIVAVDSDRLRAGIATIFSQTPEYVADFAYDECRPPYLTGIHHSRFGGIPQRNALTGAQLAQEL